MCWVAGYSQNSDDKRYQKISDTQSMMTADEEKAVNLVQDLVQYKDGQYELVITRQKDPECLPDNYGMAVKKMMAMIVMW